MSPSWYQDRQKRMIRTRTKGEHDMARKLTPARGTYMKKDGKPLVHNQDFLDDDDDVVLANPGKWSTPRQGADASAPASPEEPTEENTAPAGYEPVTSFSDEDEG